MRRAEQVISGLPPGPAANAARGLPHRAGRQPERSPRRAGRLARGRRAHRDSKTVRREPGCARNHQEGHLQRGAPSVPTPESPERAKSKAPSHQHAPSVRPRTPAPSVPHAGNREFSTKWRTKRTARRIRTWRRAVRTNRQRREERDEFGGMRRAEQVISGPTARAGCERNPADHRAEQNADHHRVRAEQYISARKTPSATRFADGTPERRQPTETNTSTSPPSVPAPESSGPTRWRDTHSPPRTECPPYRPGAECCARGNPLGLNHGHSRHGRTRQRDQTRSFTHTDRSTRPAARCHVRAEAGTSRRQPDSRAEQPIPPEDAERTTISKRYDGTPTGPGTRRDAHHHEPAERTGPRTFRAHRTHLRSRQERNHPGPVDQRSSPHTRTRITRPDRPTGAERTGPGNAPLLRKKIGHPREQKAGIWRPMVHGTEKCTPLCAGAAISCSQHST